MGLEIETRIENIEKTLKEYCKEKFPWWVRFLARKLDVEKGASLTKILDEENNYYYALHLINDVVWSASRFELYIHYLFRKYVNKRDVCRCIKHIEKMNDNAFKNEMGFKLRYFKNNSHMLARFLDKLGRPEYFIPKQLQNKIIRAEDFEPQSGKKLFGDFIGGLTQCAIYTIKNDYTLYCIKYKNNLKYYIWRYLIVITFCGSIAAIIKLFQ